LIHWFNRANRNYGIHPNGFLYDKDSEGSHYFGAGAGARFFQVESLTIPGLLMHCHVADDIDAGINTLYTIK
jgi:hypothetical protein